MLILECLDEADPGSEGQFLLHMFKLMEVNAQYVEVRTKRQLVALLDRPPFRVVHLTTHGRVDARKRKFHGLWTPTVDLTLDDLPLMKDHLSERTVVATACMSGARNFGRSFVAKTGCAYYVAPVESPTPATAIYFAHLLYHKFFRREGVYGRDIPTIVDSFNKRHKNVARFRVIQSRR